jgi:hypothetical protein
MQLHDLADEFALTGTAAAELCARIGVAASAPDDPVSDADAERFRAAARAELAQGLAAPGPGPGPETTGSAPAESPFAAPGTGTTQPSLPPDDVSAGWAAPEPTGPWAPASNGHGQGTPGPGPTAGSGTGHPASWVQSADLARLDAARVRARSLINQGLGLLALGLVITVGTMALAPGGFFIVSFGTVFVGLRRIRAGRMIQAQVRRAEQQLGP